MTKLMLLMSLAALPATAATVVVPGAVNIIPLDIATVTTGGTAVNALSAGHATAGGYIFNPSGAAQPLCISQLGVASGTVSAGNTTCIAAGQSYVLTPSLGPVSVVSSDSAHPFSGQGMQQ